LYRFRIQLTDLQGSVLADLSDFRRPSVPDAGQQGTVQTAIYQRTWQPLPFDPDTSTSIAPEESMFCGFDDEELDQLLSHWGIERASVNAAAWPADEPAVSELLSALLQQTTAPKQWLYFLKPQSELYSSFFRLFTMVLRLRVNRSCRQSIFDLCTPQVGNRRPLHEALSRLDKIGESRESTVRIQLIEARAGHADL